jgi:hypothetical protein
MPFGNVTSALEKIASEIFIHKAEVDHNVTNTQFLAVSLSIRDFTIVVFRSVVKRYR